MEFILALVRHGESEANVRRMLSGWLDVDLTEHGAEELEELRSSVSYPESDMYFSSPLRRCLRTSRILFPDKVPVISDAYKEVNFRSLEGCVLSGKEEIDAYFSAWVRDEPRLDEETISDVMARAKPALLDTVRQCEEKGLHSATIVMHSGIMRAGIIALFGLEKSRFLDMSVPNGLGYIIAFDDLEPVSWRKLEKGTAGEI